MSFILGLCLDRPGGAEDAANEQDGRHHVFFVFQMFEQMRVYHALLCFTMMDVRMSVLATGI